jgi:hypothetical protein
MNDSLSVWRRVAVRRSVLGMCFLLIAPRLASAQTPDPPEDEASEAAGEAKAPEAEPSEADEAAAADAEMEAEAKASLEKSQKPPPKGKGVVWGTVTDTKFNEAIVEAQVSVQGRKQKTFADIDGRFRLELEPGKYSLRVSYELHRPSGGNDQSRLPTRARRRLDRRSRD